MKKIELQNVSYTYRDNCQDWEALSNVNLTIEEGEFLVLAGRSGCGKSTLLHLLAGLYMPTGGTIWIDGKIVTGTSVERGMVFQNYSLFPFLTARKNIMFGIRQARKQITKKEAGETADYFLDKVGLTGHGDKYPYQMSGGMQQRIAIARMLAMDAEILLLDEPFGALDPKMRLELQVLLEQLWAAEARKKTVVFVTHDIDEALILADRIVFLGNCNVNTDLPIDFKRPRGLTTLLQEETFCTLRKQMIGLYQENAGEEETYEEKYNCC